MNEILLLSFSLIGVSDSESNRKMLKTLLVKRAVNADIAEDGRVAVDLLLKKKKSFDIVFMDCEMPVMVIIPTMIIIPYILETFFSLLANKFTLF